MYTEFLQVNAITLVACGSTMHVMQPKDMFKQARQISRASQDETVPGGEAKKRGGQELRQYLLEKFAAEGMSGSEVATLAHYITRAGGLGLEDLALDPKSASKNGHRHVRNHAGQIFPEVGMTHVQCPVHRKRDSCRTVEAIPMYLPSTAFNDYITDEMVHNVSESHFRKVVGGLDNYKHHPVVQAARASHIRTKVRPIALYWDGVAYTKNDSFMAFYVTDLLTSQKFLSFLLRNLGLHGIV